MLNELRDHAQDGGRAQRAAARQLPPPGPEATMSASLQLMLVGEGHRMLGADGAQVIRTLGRLAGNSAVQRLMQVSRTAVELDAVPPEGVGLDKPGGWTEWPTPGNLLGLKPARPTLDGGTSLAGQGVTWNAGEQPQDGTYRSWAVPPGRYDVGEVRKGSGVVVVAPGYLTISPMDHALIRQGEREHVSDLERSFAMTHDTLYRAALSLAGVVYPGSPPILAQFAAVEALRAQVPGLAARLTPRRLSPLAADIDGAYHLLRRKTKQRDDSGWHTLRNRKELKTDPYYRMEVAISYKKPYEFGKHPSSEVVTW